MASWSPKVKDLLSGPLRKSLLIPDLALLFSFQASLPALGHTVPGVWLRTCVAPREAIFYQIES